MHTYARSYEILLVCVYDDDAAGISKYVLPFNLILSPNHSLVRWMCTFFFILFCTQFSNNFMFYDNCVLYHVKFKMRFSLCTHILQEILIILTAKPYNNETGFFLSIRMPTHIKQEKHIESLKTLLFLYICIVKKKHVCKISTRSNVVFKERAIHDELQKKKHIQSKK